MTPTTRGQALLPPLRAALAEMRQVLQPQPRFDAATAEITWQIAAADYAEYAMIWHERSHLDPAHVWLREQVSRAV